MTFRLHPKAIASECKSCSPNGKAVAGLTGHCAIASIISNPRGLLFPMGQGFPESFQEKHHAKSVDPVVHHRSWP